MEKQRLDRIMTDRRYAVGLTAGAVWLAVTMIWAICLADLTTTAMMVRVQTAIWALLTLGYVLAGMFRGYVLPAWRRLMGSGR